MLIFFIVLDEKKGKKYIVFLNNETVHKYYAALTPRSHLVLLSEQIQLYLQVNRETESSHGLSKFEVDFLLIETTYNSKTILDIQTYIIEHQ